MSLKKRRWNEKKSFSWWCCSFPFCSPECHFLHLFTLISFRDATSFSQQNTCDDCIYTFLATSFHNKHLSLYVCPCDLSDWISAFFSQLHTYFTRELNFEPKERENHSPSSFLFNLCVYLFFNRLLFLLPPSSSFVLTTKLLSLPSFPSPSHLIWMNKPFKSFIWEVLFKCRSLHLLQTSLWNFASFLWM